MNLTNFLWGSGLRITITSICGIIVAIAGAIAAVPPAWSTLGLPVPASQTFVHMQIDPMKLAQAATTQAVYALTLVQLQGQLQQAEKDNAAAPSPSLQALIANLQSQIAGVQAKINQGQ